MRALRQWGYEVLYETDLRFSRLLGRGFAGRRTIEFEAAQARRVIERQRDLIIIDAGANVGEWTKAFLKQAGEDIHTIYLFEPDPLNHAALCAIDDSRLKASPAALWRKSGSRSLHSDKEGSRLASLYKREVGHHGISFGLERSVPTLSLDDFLVSENLDVVDFLKLDIEGGEFDALTGAAQSLHAGKIKALSFEFGGCNIDSRTYLKDFWTFLNDLGFRLFIVNPLTGLAPIAEYHERDESFLTANYIAVLDRGSANPR